MKKKDDDAWIIIIFFNKINFKDGFLVLQVETAGRGEAIRHAYVPTVRNRRSNEM